MSKVVLYSGKIQVLIHFLSASFFLDRVFTNAHMYFKFTLTENCTEIGIMILRSNIITDAYWTRSVLPFACEYGGRKYSKTGALTKRIEVTDAMEYRRERTNMGPKN